MYRLYRFFLGKKVYCVIFCSPNFPWNPHRYWLYGHFYAYVHFQKLNDKEKFRVKNLYNLYSVFSMPALQVPVTPHKHWPCGHIRAWNYKIFIKSCTCTSVVYFYVDTYAKLLYNEKLCLYIRKGLPMTRIPPSPSLCAKLPLSLPNAPPMPHMACPHAGCR